MGGTLVVKFGGSSGVQDFTAFPVSDSQIISTVPSGAPTGPIYVRVNTLSAQSAQNFTVIGPGPYITNFSPYVGSGGTHVLISGTHFQNPTNGLPLATSAYFNGRAGVNFFVQDNNHIQVDA